MSRSSSLGYIHEHVNSHPISRRSGGGVTETVSHVDSIVEYVPSKRERLMCCALITTLVVVSTAVFVVVIMRS